MPVRPLAPFYFFWNTEIAMSISGTQKKRGRPATGERPHMNVRVDLAALIDLDLYCQYAGVSRSDVVREALDRWREANAELLKEVREHKR